MTFSLIPHTLLQPQPDRIDTPEKETRYYRQHEPRVRLPAILRRRFRRTP